MTLRIGTFNLENLDDAPTENPVRVSRIASSMNLARFATSAGSP